MIKVIPLKYNIRVQRYVVSVINDLTGLSISWRLKSTRERSISCQLCRIGLSK